MFKNALRKVFANGSVRLGGGVLLLLILMSIFAPWLGTIDPTMLDPGSQNLLPGTTNVFMTLDGDEFEHFFLMGSDSLGRESGAARSTAAAFPSRSAFQWRSSRFSSVRLPASFRAISAGWMP